MTERTSTVRSRHLGAMLAAAMRSRGLVAHDIAYELDWSDSKVSRMLSGKQGIDSVDVAAFLTVCRVTGPSREALLDLARHSRATTWCQERGASVPATVTALDNLEDTASSVTCVDAVAVPALLQTEDYTRAFLHADLAVPEGEIDERIAHRAKRQQVVGAEDVRTRFRFFLGERALTHAGFAPTAMSDQVHHILRMAIRPGVEIRVIPADHALPATYAPFRLMTSRDMSPVVYLEHVNSTIFFEARTTVTTYRRIVAELNKVALSNERSRIWLANLGAALGDETQGALG